MASALSLLDSDSNRSPRSRVPSPRTRSVVQTLWLRRAARATTWSEDSRTSRWGGGQRCWKYSSVAIAASGVVTCGVRTPPRRPSRWVNSRADTDARGTSRPHTPRVRPPGLGETARVSTTPAPRRPGAQLAGTTCTASGPRRGRDVTATSARLVWVRARTGGSQGLPRGFLGFCWGGNTPPPVCTGKLPSSWPSGRSPRCWSHTICRRSCSGRPIRGTAELRSKRLGGRIFSWLYCRSIPCGFAGSARCGPGVRAVPPHRRCGCRPHPG